MLTCSGSFYCVIFVCLSVCLSVCTLPTGKINVFISLDSEHVQKQTKDIFIKRVTVDEAHLLHRAILAL